MAFISWTGSYVTNPLAGEDGHIILSNANVTDKLVLAEFSSREAAYNRRRQMYNTSDGRTFTGVVKVQGFNIVTKPRFWSFQFLANNAQMDLFETLINAQPDYQSKIIDSFDTPSVTEINCFINTADTYRTRLLYNWHQVSFDALEEV
jgi:hypothetical protein